MIVGLTAASPALAHIDPDPTEAQAGSELSVGFTVQHGCDGSPTVQLDMRLPDGANNPLGEPPEGWTSRVDANVVTFEGGPLPDEQQLTFHVRMILPATPNEIIYFPFVQRCEVGEIRWIDIPSPDSDTELDEPAPAMQLFGPSATTQPAPAATTSSTATPSTATSSTATAASAAASAVTDQRRTSADRSETDRSSGTALVVLSVASATAVAAIVIVQSRRRRR